MAELYKAAFCQDVVIVRRDSFVPNFHCDIKISTHEHRTNEVDGHQLLAKSTYIAFKASPCRHRTLSVLGHLNYRLYICVACITYVNRDLK